MSLEYRFDYVRGGVGDAGPEVATLASKRASEGWRMVSTVYGKEGWGLFFERRLLSREEHLLPPEKRGYRKVDPAFWRDGSIADAPPLEVPSLLAQRREEWEERYADPTAAEYRLMIRELDVRVATLLEIVRRRDEVIDVARKGKCCHCGTNLVASFVGPLDRLDAEESHDPR